MKAFSTHTFYRRNLMRAMVIPRFGDADVLSYTNL